MTSQDATQHEHARDQEPVVTRPARRWLKPAIAGGLVLVAAAAYALIFAPDHYAQLQAEQSNGDSTVAIGQGVTLAPGEGWVTQPRVTQLVSWAPLHDVTVLTGAETGVEVLSPDRALSVDFWVDDQGDSADAWLRSDNVLTETLASGVELQHLDSAHTIRGVATVGAHEVRVVAHTPGELSDYRPALATLLESLSAGS